MASNRSIWPAAAWLIFRFPRRLGLVFLLFSIVRCQRQQLRFEDLQIMDRRMVITGNQNIQHGIDTLSESRWAFTSDMALSR